MHTGRNDAELRARTRIPVRVASDASDGSAGFDVRPEFERFSQADDVFIGHEPTANSATKGLTGSTARTGDR